MLCHWFISVRMECSMPNCAICGKKLGRFEKYQCYDESDMLLTLCPDCRKITFPDDHPEPMNDHVFLFNFMSPQKPPINIDH